jgi:hypothetical protein
MNRIFSSVLSEVFNVGVTSMVRQNFMVSMKTLFFSELK